MNDVNDIQNLKEKVRSICSTFLDDPWKNISADSFKLQAVSGGLSNGLGLFRCSLSAFNLRGANQNSRDVPSEVLLRFYTTGKEGKEELIQENVIFGILSEKELGPKLYGVFPGGRLEEFIPSRSTDWNDFSDLYISVAKEMAKIHSLEMPVKKTPIFEEQTYECLEDIENNLKINPMHKVPEFITNGEFEKELIWLKEEIKKLNPDVVFCHNDLQGGNILLLQNSKEHSDKKVVFIDFEYGAYNYRTFDITDYFMEQCFHYKPTVPPLTFAANFQNFPTKKEQEEFVNAYVHQLQEGGNIEVKDNFGVEEKKRKILEEIPIMRLAPLLYWSSSLISHSLNPSVDFPYLKAENLMWDLYKKLKSEITENMNAAEKTNSENV